MSEEIEGVKLSFTCNQSWDGMATATGGRHCNKCNKTVYDLTNSKADEFRKLMAENSGTICGKFKPEQISILAPVFPFWRKWLSAAMITLGFNFLSHKVQAQVTGAGNGQATAVDTTNRNEIFGGVNEVSPEFPGGIDAFNAFVNKNLDQKKSKFPCRINITFVVEKDGSLSNVKAFGRNVNEGAMREAERVVRLSPKWIPGKQNNQLRRVQYTVPVMFK